MTVYNRLFAKNKEENEAIIKSLSKFHNKHNGLSWFEHYVLFALLYQPDIEKIELEVDCGKSPNSKLNLRTDFRITFVCGTVRRLEANGGWHFFGRDFQSNEQRITDLTHLICKRKYCESIGEPCLSINDLIPRRDLGVKKESISNTRNMSFNEYMSTLFKNKEFRNILTKLKTSKTNIDLSIYSNNTPVVIIKKTTNKDIDNFISDMIHDSIKLWID